LLPQPRVGAVEQLLADVDEEAGEDVRKREGLLSDAQLRVRARIVEQTLEGPDRLPAGLGASEAELTLGIQRDDRLDRVRVLEGDDRIVSPIDHRHYGMGGPEVD